MGKSLLTLDFDVMSSLITAKALLRVAGIDTVVTSTKRSSSEQKRLWADFQRGLRRFPVARPGTSLHELGRAVDIVPVNPADLGKLVQIMRQSGFRWAGSSDRVHFDIPEKGIVAGLLDIALGGTRTFSRASLRTANPLRLTRALPTRAKPAPSTFSTKKRLTTTNINPIC